MTDDQHETPSHTSFGPADPDVASMADPHAHPVFEPISLTTSPFEPGQNPGADSDAVAPSSPDTPFWTLARRPTTLPPSLHFPTGGYHGEYNGVPGCWFSSDGYIYDPDGNRIGTT